jgi:hypothetical protein
MARPVPGRGETCDWGHPSTTSRATGMHGARRYRVRRDAEYATSLTGLTYCARTETPRLHARWICARRTTRSPTHRFRWCDGRGDPERGWGNLAVHGEEDVIPSCTSRSPCRPATDTSGNRSISTLSPKASSRRSRRMRWRCRRHCRPSASTPSGMASTRPPVTVGHAEWCPALRPRHPSPASCLRRQKGRSDQRPSRA